MPGNQPEKKLAIWDSFRRGRRVLERSAPLFAEVGGVVAVLPRVNGRPPVLARSPAMEALLISETCKVLDDYASGAGNYEGLVYMMFWPEECGRALPLYVCKSEKYGRGGGDLSANIACTLSRPSSKRWPRFAWSGS